jgi:hypothetical protein
MWFRVTSAITRRRRPERRRRRQNAEVIRAGNVRDLTVLRTEYFLDKFRKSIFSLKMVESKKLMVSSESAPPELSNE